MRRSARSWRCAGDLSRRMRGFVAQVGPHRPVVSSLPKPVRSRSSSSLRVLTSRLRSHLPIAPKPQAHRTSSEPDDGSPSRRAPTPPTAKTHAIAPRSSVHNFIRTHESEPTLRVPESSTTKRPLNAGLVGWSDQSLYQALISPAETRTTRPGMTGSLARHELRLRSHRVDAAPDATRSRSAKNSRAVILASDSPDALTCRVEGGYAPPDLLRWTRATADPTA